MLDWWQAPNCAQFLNNIIESVLQGNNVVLRFPRQSAIGFWESFERLANLQDCFVHPHIVHNPLQVKPLDVISRFFCFGSRKLREVWELTELPDWIGVCRIEFTEPPPEDWNDFLECLRRVVRARNRGSGLVCMLLHGAACRVRTPSADVGLEVFSWDGIVKPIDMRYLVSRRLAGSTKFNDLETSLFIETVSQLSGADPLLAQYLLGFSLEQVLNPMDLLLHYGRDLNWSKDLDLWHEGTRFCYEGRRRIHSALLALRGDQMELNRLLWRAQVTVLLPWLEDCRADWVDTLHPLFAMRSQPREIRVSDKVSAARAADALEFKQLRDLAIDYTRLFGRRVVTLLNELLTIRNTLAHFGPERPLSDPSPLRSAAILAYDEILNDCRAAIRRECGDLNGLFGECA